MADIDLPLWSIPPNWSQGVTERLSWLTDVKTSKTGVEQRTAVRLSPRREFEFRVNPVRNERSYFDQWMHRLSDDKCLLPIWHDIGRLTSTAVAGATRLAFATAYTEFVAGGLAVIFSDVFTHEVVQIADLDADGLDITAPLTGNWPKASTVFPLCRTWMDPEVRASALSSRVGESSLAFTVDGPNDYVAGVESLPLYEGYPLILREPNRDDSLETQYTSMVEEYDGDIGLIRRFDEVGRSFQTQFYNWTARGKQEHHELRQLLYRLKGRQKAFWLPSFNDDFFLARPLEVGSNRLSIETIGYTALGGAVEGRDRVLIHDDSGIAQAARISGTSFALGEGEERLNLSAAATFSAKTGRAGSFLSIMRLENDVIEIEHRTDSEGVCEVGVACKSLNNTRTNDGPFIGPKTSAVKNSAPCGVEYTEGWQFKLLNLPDRGDDNEGDVIGQMGLSEDGEYFTEVGLFHPDRRFCADPDSGGQRVSWWDDVPAQMSGTVLFDDDPTELCINYPGTATAGCPHTGTQRSVFYLYCRGPYWPGWRICPAVRGTNGGISGGDSDLVDGLGIKPRLANTPLDWMPFYLYYHVYADYYNENWPTP